MIIKNLLDDSLEYEIVNETIYFSLEFAAQADSRCIFPRGTHEVKIIPNMQVLLTHAETLSRDKYIQENITVYNKNRPEENYWISLRMSFGHLSDFQMASGYRVSYAYDILESHVVSFLGEFNAHIRFLWTADPNEIEAKRKLVDLKFRYYYIVDQLIYYSTVKTGEKFFQLATLLFGSLLGSDLFKEYSPSALKITSTEQKIWPPTLHCWVFSLHYYLSFFAYRPQSLETLRNLHTTLVAA